MTEANLKIQLEELQGLITKAMQSIRDVEYMLGDSTNVDIEMALWRIKAARDKCGEIIINIGKTDEK